MYNEKTAHKVIARLESELKAERERNKKLLQALNGFKDLLEQNILVRDISNDHDFSAFAEQGIKIQDVLIQTQQALTNNK